MEFGSKEWFNEFDALFNERNYEGCPDSSDDNEQAKENDYENDPTVLFPIEF